MLRYANYSMQKLPDCEEHVDCDCESSAIAFKSAKCRIVGRPCGQFWFQDQLTRNFTEKELGLAGDIPTAVPFRPFAKQSAHKGRITPDDLTLHCHISSSTLPFSFVPYQAAYQS